MSHSYDYYHHPSKDSRRNDRHGIKREEPLPSIHHMVGDHFKTSSPYDFKDVKRSLPRVSNEIYPHHSAHTQHSFVERGPTLPPIHSGHSESRGGHSPHSKHLSHSSTPRSHHDNTSYHKSSYPLTSPGASQSRMDYPQSSHGVFQALYPSKSGGLVTVSTSSSPHGILRSSELPDDGDYDPKKKHRCPECRKGFDRPSGLEQHRLRHTGERPHPCPVSDCNSTFTVRSNMTRHVRTQHNCEPEDASRLDGYSRHSAHSPMSRGVYDSSSPRYVMSAHSSRRN